MENIGIGLQLMLVGMVSVFIILIIIILGCRGLIELINKIAPPDVVTKKEPDYTAVFEAAVKQITGGKGTLNKVSKL
mgnify:CR=1 FL=1